MGKLYIIPTPIGNLEDITLRALKVLESVDHILAEDTRSSSVLLKHYEIKVPTSSFHKFNEHGKVESVVERILMGSSIALISDAGTPSISDPGFLLVREAIKRGVEVETLPGATAFVPALVNSGLPSDRFVFEGFLPTKKGRESRLKELSEERRTTIFYESPYRVVKSLEQFVKFFGEEREASISRELTKYYEETRRGTLKELLDWFRENEPKGEFVIVIKGRERRWEREEELE